MDSSSTGTGLLSMLLVQKKKKEKSVQQLSQTPKESVKYSDRRDIKETRLRLM